MTWRASTAWTSAAALWCALAAAPVVHVHQTTADAHHDHDTARLHAHPADRDHADPVAPVDDRAPDSAGLWTVDAVMSQPMAVVDAPAPAIAIAALTLPEPAGAGRTVDRAECHAHDPPLVSASGLRAPPHIPPAVS